MPRGFLRGRGAGDPAVAARHSYECLRTLLNRNTLLLERMAEIEAELRFHPPHSPFLRGKIARLSDETLLLCEDLNLLAEDRFRGLYRAYDLVRSDLARLLHERIANRELVPLALPLEDVEQAHRGLTGDKAYNLSRVREALPEIVPPGFVLTTEAYWSFVNARGLFPTLLPILQELEAIRDQDLLRDRLATIQARIDEAPVPERIEREIVRQAGRHPAGSRWAVRSSALGEDGTFSFAGQFDSLLNVPEDGLVPAYRQVLRSRFRARAAVYRRTVGLREIDTPMAVLFLALVEARSAGVLYTRDPGDRQEDCMTIHAVWGLAAELVSGRAEADRFLLTRSEARACVEEHIARKTDRVVGDPSGGTRIEKLPGDRAGQASLDAEDRKQLWEAAHRLERVFDCPLDIEWVIDEGGRLWIVQARPLVLQGRPAEPASRAVGPEAPLLEDGITIQAGRASGPAVLVKGARLPRRVPEGSILVVPAATPEIAALLPFIGGCISETGNPAGHAAALLREWSVPSLFGVEQALHRLAGEEVVGLDATNRRVHRGSPWPELARKKQAPPPARKSAWASDPLCKRIFPLHLLDPSSPQFRPRGCSSLHDIVRLVHEKAVESMFELGDRLAGQTGRGSRQLKSDIPLNLMVLDLGEAIAGGAKGPKRVEPGEIDSVPFRAIWTGIADPGVSWAGRKVVSLKGFASVLVSSVATSGTGGRSMGDRNYVLVARDYMNMNLRLAYHYTMIDTLVGESAENNFVTFRFRGGAAQPGRRELRARFISDVLLRSRFAVDRRGDLVTAWLRRYPRPRCEQALAMLGRLMACSRQMDMLIENVNAAREYADRFLAGDYEAFS